MQICLPGRPPENKGWGKTRVRGVIPSCQYVSTLGSYTQAFVNYFAQISSVFKNWIICVYLIQTALAALHKKIKEKNYCIRKKNDVKLDFMFSQHEFLLNRAYFDIPELNIGTSSFKLKQSSLRSSWNVNDRGKISRRWQRRCFWNPKLKKEKNKWKVLQSI